MIRDDLINFGSNLDPGRMAANTWVWVGNVIDLETGYAMFPSTRQDRDIGIGTPFYVHFDITTDFDTAASRTVRFGIASSDTVAGGVLGGTPTVHSSSGEFTAVSGSNTAVAGTGFVLVLPPAENYNRYLGVGVRASTADNNEAGRFQAWLATSQASTRNFPIEGRRWV